MTWWRAIAVCALCSVAQAVAAAGGADDQELKAIWIDTDPACHLPGWHDVDDCLALRWLLDSDRVRVRGTSSVAGNTPQPLSVAELRLTLARIGHGVDAGGGPTLAAGGDHAASALAAALARERLVIVALGPLSNVARALDQRPELASRIDTVYFIGGTLNERRLQLEEQRWTHFHDRNVTQDAAAVATLAARNVPLMLLTFHGMAGLRMQADDLSNIARGAPALASAVRDWAALWRQRLGIDGFVPFDLVAAAAVTHREFFTCRPVRLAVQNSPWALTNFRRSLTLIPATEDQGALSCRPTDARALEQVLRSVTGPADASRNRPVPR